jgi:hypothetical protein
MSHRVTNLNLFPGKGMRPATANGKPITALTASRTGFEHQGVGDREIFAVAHDKNGIFTVMTPRGRDEAPGRDNVHPGDRGIKRIGVDIAGEGQVRLSASSVGELALDLSQGPGPAAIVALHSGEVWGFDLGIEAADFIQTVTGRKGARLMRANRSAPRLVGPQTCRDSLASDGYPYLLGVDSSLQELNDLRPGADPIPMLRYRPNIVVDDLEKGPFSEHMARRVAVGRAVFRVASGSIRCIVTNLDEDGQVVGGGLSALRPRTGLRVDDGGEIEGGRAKPIFCVNLTLETGELGAASQVVSEGEPVETLLWAARPHLILDSVAPGRDV